jgi:virginiamycin B lyase
MAVLVTRLGGVPTLKAQLGKRAVTARGRRIRAHRYRAKLRFPAAGSWRLSASLGRRRIALGTIRVTPAPYLLDQPAQALVLDDGSLLVTERGSKDLILQVEPATGRFRVFATGVPDPFGLARSVDGSILISSDAGMFRVPASGGRATRVADVPTSPILVATTGEIYYGHLAEIGRITGTGVVERLPVEVNAPHGVAFAADGDLIVSDTGNDRILRVDLPSGHASVLASELRTPLGLIAEPGATTFLVLEFDARALTRLDESGRTTTVATGFDKPYALTRAADGTVYVIQVGELSGPSGRIRRVAPDGSVSTVRLVRG